jgi:hypothetical protein
MVLRSSCWPGVLTGLVPQVGLAGKLVSPSWDEAVSTTAAVLASIVALCAMVTAIDGFWLATYRVRLPRPCTANPDAINPTAGNPLPQQHTMVQRMVHY